MEKNGLEKLWLNLVLQLVKPPLNKEPEMKLFQQQKQPKNTYIAYDISLEQSYGLEPGNEFGNSWSEWGSTGKMIGFYEILVSKRKFVRTYRKFGVPDLKKKRTNKLKCLFDRSKAKLLTLQNLVLRWVEKRERNQNCE